MDYRGNGNWMPDVATFKNAAIKLIGTAGDGKVVACESTNAHWHAAKIAAEWKNAGLTVTINGEAAA